MKTLYSPAIRGRGPGPCTTLPLGERETKEGRRQGRRGGRYEATAGTRGGAQLWMFVSLPWGTGGLGGIYVWKLKGINFLLRLSPSQVLKCTCLSTRRGNREADQEITSVVFFSGEPPLMDNWYLSWIQTDRYPVGEITQKHRVG